MVISKFKVIEKTEMIKHQGSDYTPFRIKLVPVQGEPFGKYTPCGYIEMTIQNDEAAKQLKPGSDYEVTFRELGGI